MRFEAFSTLICVFFVTNKLKHYYLWLQLVFRGSISKVGPKLEAIDRKTGHVYSRQQKKWCTSHNQDLAPNSGLGEDPYRVLMQMRKLRMNTIFFKWPQKCLTPSCSQFLSNMFTKIHQNLYSIRPSHLDFYLGHCILNFFATGFRDFALDQSKQELCTRRATVEAERSRNGSENNSMVVYKEYVNLGCKMAHIPCLCVFVCCSHFPN